MVDGYLASSHPSPPISNPRNLRKGLFQLESKGGGRTSISGIANFEFTYVFVAEFFFFSFRPLILFSLGLELLPPFPHLYYSFLPLLPLPTRFETKKLIRARTKSIKFWKSCARNKVCVIE